METKFLRYCTTIIAINSLFVIVFTFIYPYFIAKQSLSDAAFLSFFTGFFYGISILIYTIIRHSKYKGAVTLSTYDLQKLTEQIRADNYTEIMLKNQSERTFIHKKSHLFNLSMLVIKPLNSEQWLISWNSKKERSLVLG